MRSRRTSAEEGGHPGGELASEIDIDQLVSMVRAEVHNSSIDVLREIRELHTLVTAELANARAPTAVDQSGEGTDSLFDQLAEFVRDEIAKSAHDQQTFYEQLFDRQREKLSQAVARVLAERGASAGQIREEHNHLRDELKGFIRAEIASVASDQQTFEPRQVDRRENAATKSGPGPNLQAALAHITKENRGFRQQLTAFVHDEMTKLAHDQKAFQEGLIDRQRKQLSQIVAKVLAERGATARQFREENERLGEQLASQLGDGVAKGAHDLLERAAAEAVERVSAEFGSSLASISEAQESGERTTQAVSQQMEAMADEQRKFRARLAAAAGLAEGRFDEFRAEITARIDEIDPIRASEVVAAAVAALSAKNTQHLEDVGKRLSLAHDETAAQTRELLDQRLEELSRAVEIAMGQQEQLESMVDVLQKQVNRLARQKATGRIELDDEQIATLRQALRTPPAKKASAAGQQAPRAALRAAAATRRKRPPSS